MMSNICQQVRDKFGTPSEKSNKLNSTNQLFSIYIKLHVATFALFQLKFLQKYCFFLKLFD